MLNEYAGSIEDIDEIRIRIIEAIDRPIDELSIRDICARAHISKQTFYSRFSSKYDIANWFCARFEERTLNQIGRTLTWEEGVLAHFKTIAQHVLRVRQAAGLAIDPVSYTHLTLPTNSLV